LETVELVLEVAALGTRGGNGGADEHGAQVDIALAGAPALLLASALMVAGTHAGPCGEMVDAEEDAHIDADLGDQDGGDHPIDPRNLHQQGVLDAVRRPPKTGESGPGLWEHRLIGDFWWGRQR